MAKKDEKIEKTQCQCDDCNCENDECGCEDCNCEDCNCESGHECECEACKTNSGEEYLKMAQRIQADFDNYRKRTADVIKNARIDGIVEATSKMFPAIDAIDKSKNMIKDEKVLEGINMIEKELKQSLTNLGIEEIDVLGKPLNPQFANVVAVVSDNLLEDGVVSQVFQAGYKLNDRVLRYAQVVVNKLN